MKSTGKPTVIGVMLDFLRKIPSHNESIWSDGRTLESHRVVLGRWKLGEALPAIRTIRPRELKGCIAPRTVSRHHKWYEELVNYTKNNLN